MFVSKSKEEGYKRYLQLKKKYRQITKKDEKSLRVQVLVLETKGKPPWDSFQGYIQDKADIFQVGAKFTDLYLINTKRAVRFCPKNGKVLIKR